jgi:hypothetical protein
MSSDRQIITRHSAFDVFGPAHTVRWDDGSSVELHEVQVCGITQPFLRALRQPGLHWAVVDLRKLCPTIEPDLKILPLRDHQGAVFYNLRADYRNASDFTLATFGVFDAMWEALDVPAVLTTPMVPA